MPSSLLSGSVKSSPAVLGGYGLFRPHLGSSTCRLGSKRPIAFLPLRVKFGSSPSSAPVRSPEASPPSDFKAAPPVPLLLLPPHILEEKVSLDPKLEYAFYSPSETKHVAVEKNHKSSPIRDDLHWIGTSKGWIVGMSRRDCSLYLFSPLSPSTPIIALPPIETLPVVKSVTDSEFVLSDWYREDDENTEPVTVPSEDLINLGFISRISVSSAPNNLDPDLRNCIVAIVYGMNDNLAFCRVGDTVWSPAKGRQFRQILFSIHDHLKLFAITWSDDVNWPGIIKWSTFPFEGWEVIIRVPYADPKEDAANDGLELPYLVESATEPDHLIMAVLRGRDYNYVDVHKLNLLDPKKTWVRVAGLEDQTLFVGDFSETLSVPAPRLPSKVKPNYIYYANFRMGELGAFSLDGELEDDSEEIEAYQGLQVNLRPNNEKLSYVTLMERYRKESEGWLLWGATYL